MAFHLIPIAKLALMAGKAGSSKAAGTAVAKNVAAISAKKATPQWLIRGALAGLIGFKLLFLLVLAHKRNITKPPTRVGHFCPSCGHFINLNELSRQFTAQLRDREFVFSGKCSTCGEILAIKDSALKTNDNI